MKKKSKTTKSSARKKSTRTSGAKKNARPKKKTEPIRDSDGNVASPDAVRDEDDPGDEMQRRIRYQNAYAVILLVGAAKGDLPYGSIWCEHHDDLLASINGKFDSYQVKTAFPELGYWELNSDGLVSAITKFTQLQQKFPGKINRFKFVSNAKPSKSKAKKKIHNSPVQLQDAVNGSSKHEEVEEPFQTALTTLGTKCSCSIDCLYHVLKHLDFVLGPSLDDFEAAISVDHVGKLPRCVGMVPAQIHKIRDELIQKITDASSRRVADGAKHWSCIDGDPSSDPWLIAKQVKVTTVEETINEYKSIPFRFSPIETKTDKRMTQGEMTRFEKKLIAGGLISQLETMRRRTISAENHLLQLSFKQPDEIKEIRNQLECYVQGVCDDASILTLPTPGATGQDMMRVVLTRLQKTAGENPEMVCSQQFECLVGIAGLLTEACKIWWSPEFDIEGGAA